MLRHYFAIAIHEKAPWTILEEFSVKGLIMYCKSVSFYSQIHRCNDY